MKAKEWVDRLKDVPAVAEGITDGQQFGELLAEFTKETSDLVTLRTKGSTPETRYGAAEGAIREQANKFRTIVAQVPGLASIVFENLVAAAVPDLPKWRAASQRKAKRNDDGRDYRKRRP